MFLNMLVIVFVCLYIYIYIHTHRANTQHLFWVQVSEQQSMLDFSPPVSLRTKHWTLVGKNRNHSGKDVAIVSGRQIYLAQDVSASPSDIVTGGLHPPLGKYAAKWHFFAGWFLPKKLKSVGFVHTHLSIRFNGTFCMFTARQAPTSYKL